MKDAISKILNHGEATAKVIAKAAGIELGDVLKVLNAMHRDAEVEREKRNGNEYVYWLTTPSKPAGKADMGNPISGPKGAAERAQPGQATQGVGLTDDQRSILSVYDRLHTGKVGIHWLWAAAASIAAGDSEEMTLRLHGYVRADDFDALRKEAHDQRQQIAELDAESIRLADAANKALRDRDQARQSETEKHNRMLQACSEADNLRADRDAMKVLFDEQRLELEQLRAELAAIPTVEAHTAGYLIRAPKRKPAIVSRAESAMARAMAAARNGSGRADVYALVLTGTARRGAEWRPA